MMNIALVFLGGGIGAAARYLVGDWALKAFGPDFPYGTWIVNVAGSFVMGVFIGWLARRGGASADDLRLFVATGMLGGFTTFSAFSLDAFTLWEKGLTGSALIYTFGTVVTCILAVAAGLFLARQVVA